MRATLVVSLALTAVAATPATASAATFESLSTKGLRLTRVGLNTAAYKRVHRLQVRGYERRRLSRILTEAERTTQPLSSIDNEVQGLRGLIGGFRWDDADEAVTYWIPQGITGSADAVKSGVVDGHRELLVSWYSNDGRGARVTLVGADDIADGITPYRHILLVQPTRGGGFDNSIPIHAGGIAWYKNFLYVADTEHGLRVFDMRRILSVPPRLADTAPNYSYILPQVGHYEIGKRKPNFSYVSVDRGGPALVTGEWSGTESKRPIIRWKLNPRTGLLAGRRAASAYKATRAGVQGALMHKGRIVTASSDGSSPGTAVTGAPGRPARRRQWAVGPEDLHYAGTSHRVYSLTEYQFHRAVFWVDANSLRLPR